MRLACSPTAQILCGLLLLVSCVLASSKLELTTESTTDSVEGDNYSDEDLLNRHKKQLEDEINLEDVFDAEQIKDEQLPILPPIILLDFVNGTEDSLSNSTEQNDEKLKRTIDGSLGYGYNRNDLFSGKHNFYFPAGKTGTTVSIEESISPFEPKTVTEIVKPITENSTEITKDSKRIVKASFETLPDPLPLQNGHEPTPIYPPYPVFGQRTKLQKTSPSYDFENHQSRPPTKQFSGSYTISGAQGTDEYKKFFSTYTSASPPIYQTGSSGFSNSANLNGYVRPITTPFLVNYASDIYSNSQKSPSDLRPNPTASPSNQELNLANYPRYTIENGVKYEHKIVWKYPDGKISETPPVSYVNSYAEYSDQQRMNNAANAANFRPSTPYQPRPLASQQHQTGSITGYTMFGTSPQNNIYSQRPVQFPNDQEQPSRNQPIEQTKYTSSSIMGATPTSHYQTANYYNMAAYQGQFGLKQNIKSNGYKHVTNHKNQYTSTYNHQPIPKYTSNSPDPEYSYNKNRHFQNLFTQNGQIDKQVLSRYSPEAQQYLMKVFAAGKTTTKNNFPSDASESYVNTDYSNLLNYNPSISQYIKNPSSILNAQPTFVQAGNSLIPVIILRVDGAPPIQPKVASNINLKSLLREYLTQYANSVSKVTKNTNYNLGSAIDDEEDPASQANPVEDLKHLAENLAALRQRGHQDPDFTSSYTSNYPQQSLSQASQEQLQSSTTGQGYSDYIKDYQKIYSGQYARKPQQKVKSVQIIEDPRFTSYKVDN